MTEHSPREDNRASCLMAFQFLTRLPVPSPGLLSNEAAGRSLLFYPLVGLLIGALLWLLQAVLQMVLPDYYGVQALLLLVFWVLITGGLHLDGLADSADAWAGGLGDKERTLNIMKDPSAGPAGVMLLVLVLLGKWVFLSQLLENQIGYWWLIPLFARSYLLLLFSQTDYVREGGLGQLLSQYVPKQPLEWLLVSLALLLFITDAVMFAVSLAVFAGLRWLMVKRLGGFTGDTAGAMVEMLEWICLLAMLIHL